MLENIKKTKTNKKKKQAGSLKPPPVIDTGCSVASPDSTRPRVVLVCRTLPQIIIFFYFYFFFFFLFAQRVFLTG